MGARSSAERGADSTSRRSQVQWQECENRSRRKRLESDLAAWLRWYMPKAFRRPFEAPHLAMIAGVLKAQEQDGRFVVAAERGIGKSTLLWGCVLMLQLSGQQPFPVCVPWSKGALNRAFKFWRNALAFNDRLFADYPGVCAPFVHAKGVSQRVSMTTWKGGPRDGQPTGAALAACDGLIILPDSMGCIGGATINGNPRGLNNPMPDGTNLRPTMVLVDDVQDRDTARSSKRVRDTIAIIDGDVAGLSEAGDNIPVLLAGNCIEPEDVMAHYLAAEEWHGVRIPCVESWPIGWDDGNGPTAKLWQEWYDRHTAGDDAEVFYVEHRAEMIAGFVLTAPGAFKVKAGVPDAFCAAMVSWHKMGATAFAAEKQQAPIVQGATIYTLTPAVVCSRVDGRAPGVVPDWVRLRVCFTDVNPSYGAKWALVGFGADQTAAVLGYGSHPLSVRREATEAETARAVYEALVAHGKQLAALPCRPETWGFDARGWHLDTALRFGGESVRACGLQAIPTMGFGAKAYRPYHKSRIGQPREQCHLAADAMGRKYVAWHADYWREQAQRGWTGSMGSPGSCSLPTGHHEAFAAEICREQLQGKGEVGGQMFWNWHTQPGPHDWGDCMAGSYMLAAFGGIGTGGRIAQPAKRHRPRTGVTVIPL